MLRGLREHKVHFICKTNVSSINSILTLRHTPNLSQISLIWRPQFHARITAPPPRGNIIVLIPILYFAFASSFHTPVASNPRRLPHPFCFCRGGGGGGMRAGAGVDQQWR